MVRYLSIDESFGNEFIDYKIISCLRNPMDRVLSLYLKLKRDHNNYFSKLECKERKTILEVRTLRRYRDIQNNDLSFEDYFLKYFRTTYVDWMYFDMSSCDEIIKFENLQEDFTKVVNKQNIDIDDSLAMKNKLKKINLISSNFTRQGFGKEPCSYLFYMKKTGYEFPEEDWPSHKESVFQK